MSQWLALLLCVLTSLKYGFLEVVLVLHQSAPGHVFKTSNVLDLLDFFIENFFMNSLDYVE